MIWTTLQRSRGAGALGYVQGGDGPALILLHGVGLRAEAWGAMMPQLMAQYTVYAVDMPGHGDSPLNGSTTLADFTDRIAEFAAALATPFCVAGHSMGAMIAVELALALPDQTTGVAALNAIFERTPNAARAVQSRAAALDWTSTGDPAATLERWFGTKPSGSLLSARNACANWLTSGNPEGYATAYGIFAHSDGPSIPTLNALQIPALFMTAGGDLNSTPNMSRAMARHAPQGRSMIVEGAAHMMPMTHPAQVTAGLLTTFQPPQGKTD